MGLPCGLCHHAATAHQPYIPSMNRLAALAALLILGGCQTFTQQAPESGPPVEDAAPEAAASEVTEYGSFTRQSLYALLVAELAGSATASISLWATMCSRHATQDAGVAERGFRIAEYLGADQAALDTSLIWARNAPENLDAQRAAAVQLARAGATRNPWSSWKGPAGPGRHALRLPRPVGLGNRSGNPRRPAELRQAAGQAPGQSAAVLWQGRTSATGRSQRGSARPAAEAAGQAAADPSILPRRACCIACNAATRPSHCWRKPAAASRGQAPAPDLCAPAGRTGTPEDAMGEFATWFSSTPPTMTCASPWPRSAWRPKPGAKPPSTSRSWSSAAAMSMLPTSTLAAPIRPWGGMPRHCPHWRRSAQATSSSRRSCCRANCCIPPTATKKPPRCWPTPVSSNPTMPSSCISSRSKPSPSTTAPSRPELVEQALDEFPDDLNLLYTRAMLAEKRGDWATGT